MSELTDIGAGYEYEPGPSVVYSLSRQEVPRIEDGTRSKTRSILYDWVQGLGLRHQGVLLAAIRGCDGVGKQDGAKPVMRAIRAVTLVPFDARELKEPKGFMYFEEDSFRDAVNLLSKSLDGYPIHFILHTMHALEIIGFKHPMVPVRAAFQYGYERLVRQLHLRPETETMMDTRLTEDRIKSDTVAG
jgi:hypothetical protein